MIEKQQFADQMIRLERLYPHRWSKEEEKINMRTYYKHLKDNSERVLELAVDHLEAHHDKRSFPIIEEINQAIKIVCSTPRITHYDKVDCVYCDGEGYVIVEPPEEKMGNRKYPLAKFCTCEVGKRREKAWRNYLTKERRG